MLEAHLKEFTELRERFQQTRRKANILLCGEVGVGKTVALATAPPPVLVDSFDPGGLQSISKEIAEGIVIPDTRYESEDPRHPTAYKLWEQTFNDRLQRGVFEHVGTYAIDSQTNWSEALLHAILQKDGKAGSIPTQQEYLRQIVALKSILRSVVTLPCNVVLVAHLETIKDELTGAIESLPMVVGKMKTILPSFFDEVWTLVVQRIGSTIRRSILTAPTVRYKCRTRIGRGLFEPQEEPDITALLRKANIIPKEEDEDARSKD